MESNPLIKRNVIASSFVDGIKNYRERKDNEPNWYEESSFILPTHIIIIIIIIVFCCCYFVCTCSICMCTSACDGLFIGDTKNKCSRNRDTAHKV